MNAELEPSELRELVTTRVFAAPPELLYRAWTEPAQLLQWWGPRGFTCTFHEFDLRLGGDWRFTMHGPDGRDHDNHWIFLEIVPCERLRMEHLSEPRFRVLATFEPFPGGRTKVVFRQLFETVEEARRVGSYAVPANEQLFDKLDAVLGQAGRGSVSEICLRRAFGAPRALVWQAWTDPLELAQWWGPRGFSSPRCEFDLRVGGAIGIDMRAPDGTVYPMRGTVDEFSVGERLVFTASPIDAQGHPVFDCRYEVLFEERDGFTLVRLAGQVTQVHDPAAARYLAGQEQGWSESLYRLGERVDSMPEERAP